MKSLHIATVLATESAEAIAGAGIGVKNWRMAMVTAGHRVDLITHPEAQSASQNARLAISSMLVQRWSIERPDVVHLELASNVAFAAKSAAKQLEIPVVSGFHHLHMYAAPGTESRVLKTLAQFHNGCAITVAEQHSSLPLMAMLGITEATVINRGVDTNKFNQCWRNNEVRASWGANYDTPVILQVGRIIPTKDPEGFIQACRLARQRNPAVVIVIVGDGSELQTMRNALPWATFTGELSGHDLSIVYASSDIFVLSSPDEPWGNVLMEAASSGLAIVARSGGAMTDILAPASACVLPIPNNRNELAESVAALATDQERIVNLKLHARQSACEQSWSKTVVAWENLLHNNLKCI